MVHLSDIPFVRKFSDSSIRYKLSYESLVKDLDDQIKEVENVSDKVGEVYEAKEEGEIIETHIVEWQKQVKKFNKSARELISRVREKPLWTFFRYLRLPNPVSRFRLGREVVHLAKSVADLTQKGNKLLESEIAYSAPMEKDVSQHDRTYQIFDSRQEDYAKIWEAIVREDGDHVIGIFGSPGVGKTLMTEQAYKEVGEKRIFGKVVRASIGKEVHVMNIQDQLAGYLDFHFVSKYNELDRASQLYKNFIEADAKTLVMLHDVWDVIPLEKIGIPIGDVGPSNSCKILMTSHTREVCLANKCKDPIQIKKLTDDEAWVMFRNAVGTLKIESLEDGLAEEVCKRCAGLPFLIRPVGRALKSVSETSWKEALQETEYGRFGWIDGIEPQIYACLKMSFRKLTDQLKICLFLSSIFPENTEIEIKMLFDFATGCQLLDREENIHEHTGILKSSYMLLQGKDEYTIRVPNIIRDVARSVATRDPRYGFSYIRCKSWLPDTVDYSTRKLLHLDLQGDYVGFPDDLLCPDLSILWLQCNNHKLLLSGGLLTNLRLLVIKGLTFSEEKLSSNPIGELKMLILYTCYLHKTTLSFLNSTAHNIETLCISECDLPEHHDIKPPNLFTNLSIVKISKCTGSKFLFPLAVVNCLVQMQELSVEGCYVIEEIVHADGTTDDTEIIDFKTLRSLMLDDLPRLTHFYNDNPKGISSPAERIMDNIACPSISFFNQKVAFPSLEKLIIKKIGKATEIWRYEATDLQRLEKLKQLIISGCQSLNNVFCHSVAARDFASLEIMQVTSCRLMRTIVGHGDEEDELVFPTLTELCLGDLSNLEGFCCYDRGTTSDQNQSSMIPKVTFPNIVKFQIWDLNTSLTDIDLGSNDSPSKLLSLSLKYIKQVQLPYLWQLRLQNLEALKLTKCRWSAHLLFNVPQTLERLKVLEVDHCGASTLFTSSVFRSFQKLEVLTVSNCDSLENIVEDETQGSTIPETISLPQLQSVIFRHLPRLKNSGISSCNMPALKLVKVDNCGLSTLFKSYAVRNLRQLDVSNCQLLEEIVEDEVDGETPRAREKITPLQLKKVSLHSLPSLKFFSHNTNRGFSLPELESLTIHECPLMESFTPLQADAPLLAIFNGDQVSNLGSSDLNSLVKNMSTRKIFSGEESYEITGR